MKIQGPAKSLRTARPPSLPGRETAKWEGPRPRGPILEGALQEALPNKCFYRYEPPKAADAVLKDFWKLERDAEAMLEGLM